MDLTIEEVPVGLVVVDREGVVVDANELALVELGRQRAEVEGHALTTPFIGEHAAPIDAARASAGHGEDGAEMVRARVRGVTPARHVALAFRRTADGLVVTLVEATEQSRAERIIAQMARMSILVDLAARATWGPMGTFYESSTGSMWGSFEGASGIDLVHPDDIPTVLQIGIDATARPGEWHPFNVRALWFTRASGEWGEAWGRMMSLRHDPYVHDTFVQGSLYSRRAFASIARTTSSFQSLVEGAPIGIAAGQREGLLLYANERFRQWFSLSATEAPSAFDWTSAEVEPSVGAMHELWSRATDGQGAEATVAFDLEGGIRWLRVTMVPQVDVSGTPMGWLASLQDVTAEVEAGQEVDAANARLLELARHDPLTGLANRATLAELTDAAMSRAAESGAPDPDAGTAATVGVLYCDLDGFKDVNDELGHAAGDAVLVEVAERIRRVVREHDTVSRVGGDELVVLLESLEPDASVISEMAEVAERILTAVTAPMEIDGNTVSVGVSIGAAGIRPNDDVDSLIRRADRLMYEAKRLGRGRVVVDDAPTPRGSS